MAGFHAKTTEEVASQLIDGLVSVDWRQLARRLAEKAETFEDLESSAGRQLKFTASHAAQGVLLAAIKMLRVYDVTDPTQALLWRLAGDPRLRSLAVAWAAHTDDGSATYVPSNAERYLALVIGGDCLNDDLSFKPC